MSNRNFETCCESCQIYWTCEAKWFRGERREECVCCKLCNFYIDCQIESVLRKVHLKKKLESTQA